MKKRIMLFLTCLLAMVSMAMAQTRVTGIVTSSEDGEPIVGASISVKGTTSGTVTDLNGKFTITGFPSTAKTLVISYVGMKSKEVAIKSNLNIMLDPDQEVLEELVVTAQGLTRKDKSIGYSAQKVDGEKLTIARQTDLGNAMAGKIAGARFYGKSGATFDAGTIVLRGTTSFDSPEGSEPIYVVDGTITNKNAINMDDVESINVLKGGAATALYGSQGGNGAVVITTKGGSKNGDNKAHFEVSHTLGIDTYYNHFNMQKLYGGGSLGQDGSIVGSYSENADVDTMSPDWLYGVYKGNVNSDGSFYYDYLSDESWGARFDANAKVASALYWDSTSSHYQKADPWVHNLNLSDLFQTGISNTTNVSVSKAGQDYNIRMSYTESDRTGVQQNSDAVRRYITFKGNLKATSWLNLSLDYKTTYRKNHNGASEGYQATGNTLYSYLQWGQTNVNLKDYKDYARPDGSWRSWNIISPTNLTANFHDNPYAVYDNYNHYDTYLWNVITGDAEILLPLNFKVGFRVNASLRNSHAEYKYGAGSISWDQYYGESQTHISDLTMQGRITWGDRFLEDKLSIDAAAFVEERQYHYGFLSGYTNDGLIVDNYFNLAATKNYVGASNSETHYKTRSVYGTATVGYADTYFLDANIRNDWDSRLSTTNNSYLYGSVSASVMLNQFIKGAKWLNYWKLRASASQVGSTLGAYDLNNIYYTSTKYNSSTTMYSSTEQKNPNIEPTLSTEYEIGTEFRLFNNRVRGDINYYTKDTKNQILSQNVAPQSGYGYRQLNCGLIRNRGIEIQLGVTPVMTRDFQWDLDFNIAKNNNTLVELSEDQDTYLVDGNSFYYYWYEKAVVGKPVGVITTMARWKRDEEGRLILTETTAESWGGQYRPTYETGVEKEVGNFQPDFTGGFSTNLRYKNVTLGMNFDFMIGGQLVSWTNMWSQGSGTNEETAKLNNRGVNEREPISKGGGVYVEGVDADGNAVSTYMEAYNYYHYKAYYDLDAWVYDRTYVKLREISLSYQFSKKQLAWLKHKIGINDCSVSMIATNPWLIYSACPNIDPSESSSNFIEGGQAASTRSFGFTVKLGF